jgi:hypothetical protein
MDRPWMFVTGVELSLAMSSQLIIITALCFRAFLGKFRFALCGCIQGTMFVVVLWIPMSRQLLLKRRFSLVRDLGISIVLWLGLI